MRNERMILALILAGASTMAAASAQAQTAAAAAGAQTADAAPETVIVTGRRTNNGARAEQRAAINLVNIQPAEEIQKYPDFNAAESLGRIPGVSLSTDTGEGRFVNIRGIDGNLNGTTFGGVTLLNTQPGGTYFGGGGRAVELDTIPIGAVDRLIVRKTGLPDQEAEGLGGSVELTPRTAEGIKKSFLSGVIGGGYQPAHGHAGVYRAELTGALRFGPDQTFGILAYGSYHEDGRGFDDVEPGLSDDGRAITPAYTTLGSIDLRRYNYNRRRFGFGAELTYDPVNGGHYYVRADNAGYTESVNRQILQYRNLDSFNTPSGEPLTDPANPNTYVAGNASARVSLRDEQETHLNFISAIGGRNDLNGILIDYQGSYTASTYHRDYDYNTTFRSNVPAFTLRYDNISREGIPLVTPIGFNPSDPTQFTLSAFRNTTEGAHDREWAGQVNITVPLHLLGDDSFKFGGKVRLRDKRDVTRSPQYFGANPRPSTPLAQILGPGPYTNFYNGLYDIGYSPNAQLIRNLIPRNPLFVPSVQDSLVFNDTENIYAGYAQYQATLGKFGVLAGVRVENTDGTYRNYDPAGSVNADGSAVIVAGKSNYTNVFPTVQLRYSATKDLVVRATYSTGIGRPGFNQLQAGKFVDFGNFAVQQGNPGLKPTTDDAFDITVEYYLPHNGIFSVGVFDKEFDNYVLNRVSRVTNYPGFDPKQQVTVTGYSNVKNSYARGIEAQYVQRFANLPGLLGGLGFTANVTYVDSKIAIRTDPDTGAAENSRLPGTSELTWNIGGFYEAHGVSVRVSAQSVSPSIFGIGGTPGTDTFQDEKTQVDLTASYDVTHNVNVYFNARNLTDGPLRYYEGFKNRLIQREFYDASYEAGVRFNF